MKKTIISIFLLLNFICKGQCPVVTCPSSCTITCNNPATVTATSNYSTNITSRWIGPGNVPIFSTGSATSIVHINAIGWPVAADTYTVEFKDNVSNCLVTKTVTAVLQSTTNIFLMSGSSYTQSCPNSILTFTFNLANTYPIPGGIVLMAFGPVNTTPTFTNYLPTATINTCGNYYFSAKDPLSTCQASSYTITIGCSTDSIPYLSANAFDTICNGSSTTIYAYGANSYSWNTGVTTSSINVSPNINTTYTVTGINGGCSGTQTMEITVRPQPTVTAFNKTICAGDAIKLSATGALSYSWNNYPNLQSPIVSPSVTTVYTVTGTDANGCSNVAISTVTVNECVGILPNSKITSSFSLFPNPAAEYITFSHRSFNDFSMLEIYTSLGQLLFHEIIKSESTTLSIKKLPSGLYYARLVENGISETQKFIKE